MRCMVYVLPLCSYLAHHELESEFIIIICDLTDHV